MDGNHYAEQNQGAYAMSVKQMIIKEFNENPHDISEHLNYFEQDQILPLSYILLGPKKRGIN